MSEYKTFTSVKLKGITDLKDKYPYTNAHDWPVWSPAFKDVTEESYKADVAGYEKRVKEWNEQYIAELKESGEYGKESKTYFNFKGIDSFNDSPSVTFGKSEILIPKGLNNAVEAPKFNIKYED